LRKWADGGSTDSKSASLASRARKTGNELASVLADKVEGSKSIDLSALMSATSSSGGVSKK